MSLAFPGEDLTSVQAFAEANLRRGGCEGTGGHSAGGSGRSGKYHGYADIGNGGFECESTRRGDDGGGYQGWCQELSGKLLEPWVE